MDSLQERVPWLRGLSETANLVSAQPASKAELLSDEQLLAMTLPIQAHFQSLDPNILLIIGGRGAGKSHLFRLVNLPRGLQAIAYTGRGANGIWVAGFSIRPGTIFPAETVLQRFAAGKSRTELMDFWRGLLLGSLLTVQAPDIAPLLQTLPVALVEALRDLNVVSSWYPELVRNLEAVESFLSRLDGMLDQAQRYLFVTYDDLDVMAAEWDEKRALIQALLQFWLGQWRRSRRIRPKIFLRRDLFAEDFLNFPDASKLTGNRFDLTWTPNQLYQLVFKLWANGNSDSRDYLARAGLQFHQDTHLGWTYTMPWPGPTQLRAVVQQMLGPFMGRGKNKGSTFEWAPNHLQDANGEIVPRSMLNLFALAAADELKNQRASRELLLSPTSFAAAIEQVSALRIKELVEEYPWLAILRESLDGQHVPMPRAELRDLLANARWSDLAQPPRSTHPDWLIEHLLKIGILRITGDERIHVPDIYLSGFGLKRKGGIRRPAGDNAD